MRHFHGSPNFNYISRVKTDEILSMVEKILWSSGKLGRGMSSLRPGVKQIVKEQDP
jgi:hypothetical protein